METSALVCKRFAHLVASNVLSINSEEFWTRAIDILETYGSERTWMNSACDWGVSDPLAVPKTALEMKRRGYLGETIDKVVFQNPKKFLSQSKNFKI